MHDLKKSGFFGLSDLCRYQSDEVWGGGGVKVIVGLTQKKVRLCNRRLISVYNEATECKGQSWHREFIYLFLICI